MSKPSDLSNMLRRGNASQKQTAGLKSVRHCVMHYDRKATKVARTLFSNNLPTDKARELIKPSKEAESLQASI